MGENENARTEQGPTEPPHRDDASAHEPSLLPQSRYRIETRHPIGGEMSDILLGLVERTRLPRILHEHHHRIPILAAFAFINGCVSIGLMAVLAVLTNSPFIFPSLGPTAFLFFYTPTAPPASPRNAVVGHLIGVCAGYFALAVTGLTSAPAATAIGVSWPRAIAAALSLGLTAGLMVLLRSPHPPAGATTLIVSLGILHSPLSLLILMAGVIVLTLQAIVINKLAGIDYPWWNPPTERTGLLKSEGKQQQQTTSD